MIGAGTKNSPSLKFPIWVPFPFDNKFGSHPLWDCKWPDVTVIIGSFCGCIFPYHFPEIVVGPVLFPPSVGCVTDHSWGVLE